MKHLSIELPQLPFAAEEALKRLRINVKFVGRDIRTIMITSCISNEGKSSVAIYLWKMLAESGVKTLYLDLDMRNTVITSRYEIRLDGELCGVEHYLSGQKQFTDVVYETDIPNGYIIPCSQAIENPSNLFEGADFLQMMRQLHDEYRYVIVDTPPMIDVSDGAQIAATCDSAILVVRSGFTAKKLVKQVLKQLEDVNCPVLGAVLNRVKVGGGGYGYGGYGYGVYGYGGYGYGVHKKKEHIDRR